MWPLWQGNVQRKYGRDKISVNPEGNPFRECPLTKTELALSHFFPGSGCDRKWFYHQRSDSISALPRLYWFICIIAKELHKRTHIADQNFIRSVTKDYWRESCLRYRSIFLAFFRHFFDKLFLNKGRGSLGLLNFQKCVFLALKYDFFDVKRQKITIF